MTVIGPFATQKNGTIRWLQITLGAKGVCSEFKQATEAGIVANHWTIIEQEQWPKIIPGYDPSVSQNYFVLTTDSDGVLNRHYITKTMPTAEVSSQTHTGNHFNPSVLLKDEDKKTAILNEQWIPDSETQDKLKAEYQAWEHNISEISAVFPIISKANQAAVIHAIQNLPQNDQIIKLHDLLKSPDKFDLMQINPTEFFQTFTGPTLDGLIAMVVKNLEPIDQKHYAQLNSFIIRVNESSKTERLPARELLEDTFPINGEKNLVRTILELAHGRKTMLEVENVQNTMQADLLAEKFLHIFQNYPDKRNRDKKLAALLPNLNSGTDQNSLYNGKERIKKALFGLTSEQRIEILILLLNTQNLSSLVAKAIFGSGLVVEHDELFTAINTVSVDKIAPLRGKDNISVVLRTLLATSSSDSLTTLSGFSNEFLEKISPHISPQEIQDWLDKNYNSKMENHDRQFMINHLPTAHTTEWQTTLKAVQATFLKTEASTTFLESIMTQKTPRDLKILLLSEIETGYTYESHFFVALGLQRIAEHEAAILESLNPEDRKYYTQLQSCGILGQHLLSELQCLRQNGLCQSKIDKIHAALQQLPDNLTLPMLKEQLLQNHSALSDALATPAKSPTTNYYLFDWFATKNPPLDFSVLEEIKKTVAQDGHQPGADMSPSSRTRR